MVPGVQASQGHLVRDVNVYTSEANGTVMSIVIEKHFLIYKEKTIRLRFLLCKMAMTITPTLPGSCKDSIKGGKVSNPCA